MGRKIRLTESEFHSLVRRLVIEAEEEIASQDAKAVAMDAIQDEVGEITADMSSEEVMAAIRDLQKIQRQIQMSPELQAATLEDAAEEREGEGSMSSEFSEEEDDLEMRKFKRKKNMKIAAGLGTAAAGIVGILSQGMGYTDLGDTFIAIHDAVKAVGGDYAALLSLGTIVGGIIYALKSVAQEKQVNESYYRRNNRRNYRR
jgi:hypothetical protein